MIRKMRKLSSFICFITYSLTHFPQLFTTIFQEITIIMIIQAKNEP